MACLVPGCKSNYKGQVEFTTAFNFPKDQDLREKWIRAIPRPKADYENNKQLKVCITHFKEYDIERTLEHFDGQRKVTIPRNRLALKKDAVPCIFPNCPSYLSDHYIQTKRLSKDDKERLTLEEAFHIV